MRGLIRVAATALAFAAASQFSSSASAQSVPQIASRSYDEGTVTHRIHLAPLDTPQPILPLPSEPVLSPQERYRAGMHAVSAMSAENFPFEPWQPFLAQTLTYHPEPITNPMRADDDALFFGYFSDGTPDPDNLVYDRYLGRAQSWVRNAVLEPFRNALRPIRHVHHGRHMRTAAEPFTSSGTTGVQFETDFTSGIEARVRIGDGYQSLRVGTHLGQGWFSGTLSQIDGNNQIAFGYRRQF